jgi:two-component system cell cycle response regulator
MRMAGAMGLLVLLYACWQVFRWTPGHRPLVGDVLTYVPAGAAAWAAWRASQRCSDSPRLRAAWRFIALALVATFCGEAMQTYYDATNQAPFPSVADVFYLSFYPLMLCGLLRFGVRHRTLGQQVRLGLDLAVVAIGSSAVVLYVVLGPTVVAGSANLLQGVFSVAYPVGDVVLLVGLASVLVREAQPSTGRALWFMAVGLLLYVVGDVVYGYLSLHSAYQGGDPVDTFWFVATALWAIAAEAQIRPDASSPNVISGHPLKISRTPYIGAAVGFTVLIVGQWDNSFFPDMTLAITAALIAALVAVRQFLAQRDLFALEQQASYESQHDVLTSLPNRRQLMIDGVASVASATDTAPRTLAMFDLDGFKNYNDTYGHLAGDQLLTRVAQRLAASLASNGRAYRLGGDEFCVLLDTVQSPSEIIARAAEAMCEHGTGFTISASYGLISIPGDAKDLSAALQAADTRMYAAKVSRRTALFVSQTRDVLLRATAGHSGDRYDHTLEDGELARDVARRLGLDDEMLDLTLRSGELRDVGKLAVPASVLNKPGPLAEHEWELMRNHTVVGEHILNAAPALHAVAMVVRSTHERYDGTGYPDGLSAEQIPLPARIVFACGSYHAMVSPRAYAPEMTESQAREELTRCAGTQFDPRVVEALLAELEHRKHGHLDTAAASPADSDEEPRGCTNVAREAAAVTVHGRRDYADHR